YIGLDGLSLPLVVLTSLMFFLAILVASGSSMEKSGGFFAWLMLLQTAVTGAFVSLDILLFYAFFELTLIPSFFLIGRWGVGIDRRNAARKFFLYTLFGSLFTLIGIVGVVLLNPVPLNPYQTDRDIPVFAGILPELSKPGEARPPRPGPLTFSIPQLMANHSTWTVSADENIQHLETKLKAATTANAVQLKAQLAQSQESRTRFYRIEAWLFFALLAGFAVKIPIVPFHTWLPAAYGESPLAVTMVFSAVLAKLGTFGILRVVLPLVPDAAIAYGLPTIGILGATSIGYAAFCAYAQRDLKMIAAYSSISHLGLLALGLFTATTAGLSGAMLHMVNHGLTAGALFALLAYLHDRYRTTDGNAFGGLLATHPRYAFFFILLSLAAVGLPGLNNFVSEMLILAGLFDPHNVRLAGYGLGVTGAAGIFLSAWYTFTMIRRVFFGPVIEPVMATPVVAGLTGRESTTLATLSVLCLGLGLAPQPLLSMMEPDTQRVANVLNMARIRLDPQAAPPPVKLDGPLPNMAPAGGGGGGGRGRPAGAPVGPGQRPN
ncbi:MAG: complex I subunit 4 family protein, partial [Gemmataceae bacterium]